MLLNDEYSKLPDEIKIPGAIDELKILILYAYNAYFNADVSKEEDLKDGITFINNDQYGIGGVFPNDSYDDPAIECLYPYITNGTAFNVQKAVNSISEIVSKIENVYNKVFKGTNDKADNRLKDLLDDFAELDSKIMSIRIITDYECKSEQERYDIDKRISAINIALKGYTVIPVVSFKDDIINTISSNKAPFDYVEEGKVFIDKPNNFLYYDDNSFICNISAKSLKDLWHKEGNRGLLAMNLRYYIKVANVDEKIEEGIKKDYKDFWYLNNGIIIVCNDYSIFGKQIKLKEFSIVNGGQTTRMIGTIPFDNDFFVSCKIIKNTFSTPNEKNLFISKVAEASNTQKPIKAKDIIANRVEQRNLKTLMGNNNIFIEIKRGEKYNHDIFKEVWQRTKNNELAQDIYSFVCLEPGPAHNSLSKILLSKDKYNAIFVNHSYSIGFLKSLLFLEKAYKEYKKKILKDDNEDNIKKGLIKSGQCYCLATIGYLLKLLYNPEYSANMRNYANNKTKLDIFFPEPAFNHSFIDKDYKNFKQDAFKLFNFVFDQILLVQFKIAREANESLAYSNWVKTNTGFQNAITMINGNLFNAKYTYLLDGIKNYVKKIDTEQINKNIDEYVDCCKNSKKAKEQDDAKDFKGNALTDSDKYLRDELMIYRMNYAKSVHIGEQKVFTDKMLDRIIVEKPMNTVALEKIISAYSCKVCGKKIIEIISKYI